MNTRHDTTESLQLLSTIDVLSDLSDDELARLNGQISPGASKEGTLLYAPGEHSDGLYLLARGHVQLYRLSPNGRKLVVASLQDGEIFGSLSPLGKGTTQTFAETLDDCVYYVLSRTDAERLLCEKPAVALRVLATLAERLEGLEQRLEAMAFQNIPARLAGLILRLAAEQDDGLVRGYTHQDLADMLGTYRETISETLHKFKADGLVRTRRKEVHLQDRQRLETVADS